VAAGFIPAATAFLSSLICDILLGYSPCHHPSPLHRLLSLPSLLSFLPSLLLSPGTISLSLLVPPQLLPPLLLVATTIGRSSH
ncbi:hypothetical protein B296_00002946, partial [Ensete ventricosum]